VETIEPRNSIKAKMELFTPILNHINHASAKTNYVGMSENKDMEDSSQGSNTNDCALLQSE
jgi:hypothetical protein